jgi:hypothetical protein
MVSGVEQNKKRGKGVTFVEENENVLRTVDLR